MFEKILTIIIPIALLTPALVPVFSIFTANETRVCGVDARTYPSITEAEKQGIEVSYDFPCQFPKKEEGLFERSEKFEFVGMLLDIFSDSQKTQLFVKNNFDKKDYLVLSSSLSEEESEQFITGDQIKIDGSINKNTEIVTANNITNLSSRNVFDTKNCKITNIDKEKKEIFCFDKNYSWHYNEKTRFVTNFKNKDKVDDVLIGDIVKLRLDKNNNIKLLFLIKRGGVKFAKNHIFISKANFISYNSSKDAINIKLDKYPESIKNIDGIKKESNIKLKINHNTRIVKKYFGRLSLRDFKKGDDLFIVARAKDYSGFEAITIKNNSVWK